MAWNENQRIRFTSPNVISTDQNWNTFYLILFVKIEKQIKTERPPRNPEGGICRVNIGGVSSLGGLLFLDVLCQSLAAGGRA